MSISAVNAFPTAAADRPSHRDTSFTDASSTSSFASVLAGAVHSAAPKPHPKPPKDGTSELDGPDDSSKDDNGSTTTHADDAARAGETGGTGVVNRSAAALDPALQEKLARVIARVRAETGHEVTIEETVRSQARQDTLFAQGRDSAGPVVTWTQNSKHTQGRAVDLLLDGGAAGSDAYASLQRIAGEEGLRTLGAKDPGHLELPGAGAAHTPAGDAKTLNLAEPTDTSGQGEVSVARVAQLARVAEVKVASPAAMARVANPAAAHVSGVSAGGAQGSKRDGGESTGQGDQRGGYGSLATSFTMRDLSAPAAPVQATGANGAEHVARVLAALDDAPARPLSQLTMSVDAGNGTVDRVHVALRGATLNSTIDVADLRTAQTMSAKSDELVRSLTREGLEVESLRVRGAAGSALPVVSQASQSSSGNSTGSRFERGNPWDQSGREQQQRQDSRRQQQREERRGNDS